MSVIQRLKIVLQLAYRARTDDDRSHQIVLQIPGESQLGMTLPALLRHLIERTNLPESLLSDGVALQRSVPCSSGV